MGDRSILNDQFLNLIFKAVIDSGNIALKLGDNALEVSYKSINQPVTNADLQINDYLRDFCNKNTPEFGWISEESKDDHSRKSREYFWCLDPIDGTRSYIERKSEYTIALALMKKNEPILGIVYNPKTEEIFHATTNSVAYCNKKKIKVTKNNNLEKLNIAISSSEMKNFDLYNLNYKKLLKIGSIAYKTVLVAKGEIDVTLSFTKKNDWDLAAANLILDKAGGLTTTITGQSIEFNTDDLKISSVLSSNGRIHSKLSDRFTCLK